MKYMTRAEVTVQELPEGVWEGWALSQPPPLCLDGVGWGRGGASRFWVIMCVQVSVFEVTAG